MSNNTSENTSVNQERTLTFKRVLRSTFALLHPHIFLSSVILCFVIASTVSLMYIPVLIKGIVDHISTLDASINVLLPLIAVAFASAVISFAQTLLIAYLVQKVILELRQQVVQHSLQQSMSYYNKEPVGRMVTRITKDLDEANNFFQTFFSEITRSVVSLFTVAIMLYILNSTLLLYVLCGIPLIALFSEFYRRKIVKNSQLVRAQTSVFNTYLGEHLQGARDLQLNNKVDESIKKFDIENADLYQKERTLGTYQIFVRPSLNLILMIMIVSTTIGGAFLANKAIVTIGTLFAFISLIQNFFYPLLSLAQIVSQVQTSIVSLERIFSFLDTDSSLANASPTSELLKTINTPPVTLAFQHVDFHYHPNKQILSKVGFSLNPGKKIALVGHSGSGKSTIARLCIRFWDPTAGKITLNGIELKDIPVETLRTKVTLLEQDSFIFRDTIRENISVGRDIAQDKLEAIADKTELRKLIQSYKEGWDHVLDARSISTGEQRLIAIARVLIKPPNIIVLDEFSATLDNRTEYVIQGLLEELQSTRASLIIAHRLHTIKTCDEILFIDQGKIVEQGSHEYLLNLNQEYAKLIKDMEHKNNTQ